MWAKYSAFGWKVLRRMKSKTNRKINRESRKATRMWRPLTLLLFFFIVNVISMYNKQTNFRFSFALCIESLLFARFGWNLIVSRQCPLNSMHLGHDHYPAWSFISYFVYICVTVNRKQLVVNWNCWMLTFWDLNKKKIKKFENGQFAIYWNDFIY